MERHQRGAMARRLQLFLRIMKEKRMDAKPIPDAKTFDRRFLAGLSVMLLVMVMLYVAAVTFVPIPESGAKYADIAVPLLLGTVVGGVVGYWFGASKTGEPRPAQPTQSAPGQAPNS
jgi:hypothetical protein